jgi:hypothetical protein
MDIVIAVIRVLDMNDHRILLFIVCAACQSSTCRLSQRQQNRSAPVPWGMSIGGMGNSDIPLWYSGSNPFPSRLPHSFDCTKNVIFVNPENELSIKKVNLREPYWFTWGWKIMAQNPGGKRLLNSLCLWLAAFCQAPSSLPRTHEWDHDRYQPIFARTDDRTTGSPFLQ